MVANAMRALLENGALIQDRFPQYPEAAQVAMLFQQAEVGWPTA
jgi:hypothetical protein